MTATTTIAIVCALDARAMAAGATVIVGSMSGSIVSGPVSRGIGGVAAAPAPGSERVVAAR